MDVDINNIPKLDWNILGEERCTNSQMIITGHFQPSLLTWKDWFRGNIQDFYGNTAINLSYKSLYSV